MNVLALDMTLCNTGYVVFGYSNGKWALTSAGLIESKKEKDSHEYAMEENIRRSAAFLRQMQTLVSEFCPRHLIVERLGGTKNARAATTFGLVTGVLAAFMEQSKLAVTLIAAMDGKKRLAGNKSASKTQMIRAALKLQPDLFYRAGIEPDKKGKWPNKVEHIADAYGMFLTALDGQDLRQLMQLAAEMKSEEQGFN